MVITERRPDMTELYKLLSAVCDPEIPVLTLEDLGVLRDITLEGGEIKVTITPTYAGCPALETMQADIESTLANAGYQHVRVQQSLSPAWTTDWMTKNGREKLRAYGIAPPAQTPCGQRQQLIECPQCGSAEVKCISEFGSTACKALYRCEHCLEPFDYFKCI